MHVEQIYGESGSFDGTLPTCAIQTTGQIFEIIIVGFKLVNKFTNVWYQYNINSLKFKNEIEIIGYLPLLLNNKLVFSN